MCKTRHSEEQIIGILQDAAAGVKVAHLICKHGISEQAFYRWKSKYGGMEVSEAKRLRPLADENRRLKQMVADLSLDNQALLAAHGVSAADFMRPGVAQSHRHPHRRRRVGLRCGRYSAESHGRPFFPGNVRGPDPRVGRRRVRERRTHRPDRDRPRVARGLPREERRRRDPDPFRLDRRRGPQHLGSCRDRTCGGGRTHRTCCLGFQWSRSRWCTRRRRAASALPRRPPTAGRRDRGAGGSRTRRSPWSGGAARPRHGKARVHLAAVRHPPPDADPRGLPRREQGDGRWPAASWRRTILWSRGGERGVRGLEHARAHRRASDQGHGRVPGSAPREDETGTSAGDRPSQEPRHS
ncbi:MAG: transposase [Planctomycetes bacterium]|nr:transposase [Planctomycetota bacterium]